MRGGIGLGLLSLCLLRHLQITNGTHKATTTNAAVIPTGNEIFSPDVGPTSHAEKKKSLSVLRAAAAAAAVLVLLSLRDVIECNVMRFIYTTANFLALKYLASPLFYKQNKVNYELIIR